MNPQDFGNDIFPGEPEPATGFPNDPQLPDVQTGLDDWSDDADADPDETAVADPSPS